MTTFLTLAIYSLRVSGDLPVQSQYFPLISIFFFIGLLLTFIAFVWFIAANSLRAKQRVPKILEKLCFICSRKPVKVDANRARLNSVNNQSDSEKFVQVLNQIVLYSLSSIMLLSYIVIWLCISFS